MADGLKMALEIEGEEKIEKMLTQVGLDIRDLRPAMQEVGDKAKRYFSGQVFASRGGAINQSWPRLSSQYAVAKAKRWPGRPVLVQTGKMQNSFVSDIAPMSVTIRNTDPKFPFHQSSASRHHLPRRAMIGIYNGMQSDVTSIIAAALAARIRKNIR